MYVRIGQDWLTTSPDDRHLTSSGAGGFVHSRQVIVSPLSSKIGLFAEFSIALLLSQCANLDSHSILTIIPTHGFLQSRFERGRTVARELAAESRASGIDGGYR